MDRAVQSPGSGSVSPPAAKHLLRLGSCSFLAPDSSVSSGLVVGVLGNSGSFCEKTGKKGTSVVAWLPRVQLEFLGAGSGSSAPQISLFEEAENKLCAFKKAQVLEEAPAYLHVKSILLNQVYSNHQQKKSLLSLKDPLGKPSHFSRILSILLYFAQAMGMNISLSLHAVNYDGPLKIRGLC